MELKSFLLRIIILKQLTKDPSVKGCYSVQKISATITLNSSTFLLDNIVFLEAERNWAKNIHLSRINFDFV